MLKQMSLLCILFFLLCNVTLAQDTDGADIWLSKKEIDLTIVVLPGSIITYAADPDMDIVDIWLPTPCAPVDPDLDGTDIWTPSPTGGGGTSGGGQMTKPPGCGYKGTVSDPTKNGCEYVTFNGTDKDGNPFSVTAQVYIYGNTPTAEKAQEISDELNRQSDNTTNDPIVSQAAPSQGTFVVQPAAGGKITSAEWDNGSGEEDNSLEEMFGPEKAQTTGTRVKGNPTGVNSKGTASFVMIGFGQFKISTFIQAGETSSAVMKRLEEGLQFLGIRTKTGFDAEGDCWLIWDNPLYKARFGCNDTGLSHMIVSDKTAPSVKSATGTMKVGRYEILLEQ